MRAGDSLRRFIPQFEVLMLNLGEKPDKELTELGGPLGWLLSVVKRERASESEFERAITEALAGLEPLAETDRQAWKELTSYLVNLVVNRRPAEEGGDPDGSDDVRMPVLPEQDPAQGEAMRILHGRS